MGRNFSGMVFFKYANLFRAVQGGGGNSKLPRARELYEQYWNNRRSRGFHIGLVEGVKETFQISKFPLEEFMCLISKKKKNIYDEK